MSEINNEKKDLVTILQISSKYDMRDNHTTRKLLAHFKESGKMNSSIGKRYVERLTYIASDVVDNQFKCLVCQNEIAEDGIICGSCMNRLSGGKLSIHDKVSDTVMEKDTVSKTRVVEEKVDEPASRDESAEVSEPVAKQISQKREEKISQKKEPTEETKNKTENTIENDVPEICPCCGQPIPEGTVLKGYKTNDKSTFKLKWWQIAIAVFIVLALIGGLIEAISSSKRGNNKDEIASKAPDFDSVYDTSDYYDADYSSDINEFSEEGPYSNSSEEDFATYEIKPEAFNEAYVVAFRSYVDAIAGKKTDNYSIKLVYSKDTSSGEPMYDIFFDDENEGSLTFKLNSHGSIDEVLFTSGMNAKTVTFIACPLMMAIDSSLDAVSSAEFLAKLVNQFDADFQTGAVTPLSTGNFNLLYGYYDGISMISIKPR